MSPRVLNVPRSVVALLALLALGAPPLVAQDSYTKKTSGSSVLESPTGLSIKVLVEENILGGGELEIAEITFPGKSPGGEHIHESTEIFYVLSGRLGHIVEGEEHILEPGDIGIVRAGEAVSHRVFSDEPVKALVIWFPGGEVDRLRQFLEERPLD